MMAPHLPGPWSSALYLLLSAERQREREGEQREDIEWRIAQVVLGPGLNFPCPPFKNPVT